MLDGAMPMQLESVQLDRSLVSRQKELSTRLPRLRCRFGGVKMQLETH